MSYKFKCWPGSLSLTGEKQTREKADGWTGGKEHEGYKENKKSARYTEQLNWSWVGFSKVNLWVVIN